VKNRSVLNFGMAVLTFGAVQLSSGQSAEAQQFARLTTACVTLECAIAAANSYSFSPPEDAQERNSETTPATRPITNSDYVREGEWRSCP
jgi:hypothetical protein